MPASYPSHMKAALVALAAEWVLYDDRSAAPCTSLPTEEQVVQCNAYMLFYEKLSTLE